MTDPTLVAKYAAATEALTVAMTTLKSIADTESYTVTNSGGNPLAHIRASARSAYQEILSIQARAAEGLSSVQGE